ncbi:MAG: hypothetical protein NTZ09_11690 [Candidatus Hydrogenedentes bacterium]|nr:hypothetical protein [Candidatus Hydrogenedentota bacterium]
MSDTSGDVQYSISGRGDADYFKFDATGTFTGPCKGYVNMPEMVAAGPLPDTVGVLREKTITWTISVSDESIERTTGPHTVFRTYAYPGTDYKGWPVPMAANWMTTKRADGCCSWAEGHSSASGTARSLWDNMAEPNDPPYEPGEVPGKPLKGPGDWKRCWELLDGNVSGQCDPQAALMASACNLLGVEAKVGLVHASLDAGASHCLNQEKRKVGLQWQYLYLDADPGTGFNMQQWEGCCVVEGRYYALWPKIEANDDYDMLKNKLGAENGWTQWWCRLDDAGKPIPVEPGPAIP